MSTIQISSTKQASQFQANIMLTDLGQSILSLNQNAVNEPKFINNTTNTPIMIPETCMNSHISDKNYYEIYPENSYIPPNTQWRIISNEFFPRGNQYWDQQEYSIQNGSGTILPTISTKYYKTYFQIKYTQLNKLINDEHTNN